MSDEQHHFSIALLALEYIFVMHNCNSITRVVTGTVSTAQLDRYKSKYGYFFVLFSKNVTQQRIVKYSKTRSVRCFNK